MYHMLIRIEDSYREKELNYQNADLYDLGEIHYRLLNFTIKSEYPFLSDDQ
jgi:hypothetical protein